MVQHQSGASGVRDCQKDEAPLALTDRVTVREFFYRSFFCGWCVCVGG